MTKNKKHCCKLRLSELNVRVLKLGTQEQPETLLKKSTLTKHDYFIDSIFIAHKHVNVVQYFSEKQQIL